MKKTKKIFFFKGSMLLISYTLALFSLAMPSLLAKSELPTFLKDYAVLTKKNSNTNTYSTTIPAGTSRLLVVTLGVEDMTIAAPTIDFNGATMTLAGEDTDIVDPVIYNARVLVYYLALGSGGNITSTFSVTGLSIYTLDSYVFENMNQTSPLVQTTSAAIPTGSELTSQISTSMNGVTQGNLLLAFLGDDNHEQFRGTGPYCTNCSSHTNTGTGGNSYYYTYYTSDALAGNQTLTFDINNATQSCAGVLVEFATMSAIVPVVNLSLTPITIDEVTTASLDYTFTLDQSITSDLTIPFQLAGTAEDDDDFTVGTAGTFMETVSYTPTVGAGNNRGTITIKAGQTQGVLQITPKDDPIFEADETVRVTIVY